MVAREGAHELLDTLAVRHGPRILSALMAAGTVGMTDHELAHTLGIYLSSVNAARNGLMRRGHVKDSGRRRPSGRGGVATVWIAA